MWVAQDSDQIQGYKDCLNCRIPDPTMIGAKENFLFLDVLKCFISELILPEKTWKGIETVLFKI